MSGSTTTINGAAGGLLQDEAGNSIIQLGTQSASVLAGLGTDTVLGGNAALTVFAYQDPNNIDVQGGAGSLAVSLLFATGSATISGGSAGETITGGLGSITLTQAGALTLHPSNGTIDIRADGQAITIWASDNSGYEVFTPTAGTTLVVAPTPDGYGHTLVTIGNSETVELGNGFETIGSSLAYLTGASATTYGNAIIAAPPVPTVTGLTVSTGTSLSASAGITTMTEPAFTGTAVAGDEVLLYKDGFYLIGETVANAEGNWTVTADIAFSGGTHTVNAEVVNIAGVISNVSNTYTVDIDTAGPSSPTITGLDPSTDSGVVGDSTTNIGNVELDGTSDQGDNIVLFDGTISIGSGSANASGSWSVTSTVDLANGAHDLTAIAVDGAGRTSSASSVYVVTIDTTPPPAPTGLTLDPGSDSGVLGDDLTNVTTPTIDGNALPDETITISVDGNKLGTVATDEFGNWSYAIPSTLSAGSHAVAATATDEVGNVSTAATLDLTIETIAPTPAITAIVASGSGTITASDQTNAATVTVSGTALAGATIVVSDNLVTAPGSVVANGSGIWSEQIVLSAGANSLTAMVTSDAAGNSSAASTPVVLDADLAAPAAPAIIGITPATDSGTKSDNVTDINPLAISGTGAAGDVLTLTELFYNNGSLQNSAVLGTATVAANGTWVVTGSVAASPATLVATQSDFLGDVSPASTAYDLTIVNAPSAPTLSLAGGNSTSSLTPSISVSESGSGLISFYDSGTTIGTIAATGTIFTPGTQLTLGLNTITAVFTDQYGDVSTPGTLTIDVTGTAPTLALDAASESGSGSTVTNVTRPKIDGTSLANSQITILDNGGTIGSTVATTGGIWTFTPATALLAGANTLTAIATLSGAGSLVSSPFILTIETAAAAPVITGAAAGNGGTITAAGLTNAGTVTLSGTAAQGATIVILDNGITLAGSAGTNGAGNWSEAASLQQGPNTLTAIVSYDSAGNRSSASAPLVLTAYPTTPNAPAITGLSSIDTGGGSGYLSAVRTPTLTGTGMAGDTVELLQAGTVVGTGTVGASGAWSVAVTATLAFGRDSITAEQLTPFGSASSPSAAATLTIEPISAPTLDASGESGSSNSITNCTTPKIDGTATPNATIVLLDNNVSIGTATASAAGTWSVTAATPLANGANTLVAEVGISSGVTVGSSAFVLTIETSTVVPGITLDPASDSGILGDDLTNVTKPTLLGTAAGGAKIVLTDNGTLLATATASAADTWSYTPTTALPSGLNVITGVATDVAGNVSTATTLDLTIETSVAPPTVLSFSPDTGLVAANNDTGASVITLSGTAAAGSEVALYNDGTEVGVTTTSTGQWSVSSDPTVGTNTYTAAIISDPAGNASGQSAPFVVTRMTPPAAPIIEGLAAASDSGVGGDGITNVTKPTILGTGVAGDLVSLANAGTVVGTGSVAADGTWAVTSTAALANGTYTLVATITDAAGDVSAASNSYSLTIDTIPPPAPTLQLNPSAVNPVLGTTTTDDRTPGLEGAATANDLVSVYNAGTLLGTTTANAQGTWSLSLQNPLAIGSDTITATVTDQVGNVSAAASLALNITTIPTAAATIGLALASDSGVAGDGITNVTDPELVGSAPAGDTVIISANSKALGTVVATAQALWSYTPAVPFSNGSYVLQATATDPISDTTTTSQSYALQIDTAPPAAPTIQSASGAASSGGTTVVTNADPTISGTGPAASVITLFNGGVILGTTTASAAGAWSLQPSEDFTSGSYALTAKATDIAGNVSSVSAPFDISVQLTQPLQLGVTNLPTIVAQPLEEILGAALSPTSTINVTYYSYGAVPPTAATGASLAMTIGNADVNDTVSVPNATTVVSNTADGAVTIVGSGSNQLFLSTGSNTTFYADGASGVYLGNQAAGGVNAPSSSTTVYTPTSGGGNYVIDTGSGNNTIEALSGNDTIAPGSGSNKVFLGSGTDYVDDTGIDTVSCGTGADTVNAGSDSYQVEVFANTSQLTFRGNNGNAVIIGDPNPGSQQLNVVGWGGSDTVFGSLAGGVYYGGTEGNNDLVASAGTGQTTLVGGQSSGNLLVAQNSANDVLVAGGGDETLFGEYASGDNIYFTGTGSNLIQTGEGSDTVVMGEGAMAAGTSTVWAGTGNILVWANTSGEIITNTGQSTLIGGGASDLYIFSSSQAGGNTLIDNYNPNLDQIGLWGYSSNDLSTALANQLTSGGSTSITLPGGTTITFAGIQHVDGTNFTL